VGIRLHVEVLDYAPTTLTHREKLLLGVLAVDANDKTRTTWNSVESPEVLRRAQLSRAQLYAVIKKLIAKGVLKKLASGQKNGVAKYLIPELAPPGADLSVSDSETLTDSQCQQIPDTDESQCPDKPDTETDPQCQQNADTDESQCQQFRDVSVSNSGTPTLLPSLLPVEGGDEPEAASRYPAQVLPLVHAMSASGFENIRWPFKGNEWFPLIALIKEVGIKAMVEYAHRAAASARNPVVSARYFIDGWHELPPAPPEDAPVYRPAPHLRVVNGPHHNPAEEIF
jgi:hypothetical protein